MFFCWLDNAPRVWYTYRMIRCVLFDRDGTLGELGDKRYPASFRPYCDIKSAFAALKNEGYLVGIVTNQSSVARGTGRGYDFDSEFAGYGADIWKICPHDNEDNCDCRKPKSGLLYAACDSLRISPRECLIVGDRVSDLACALNAGAAAALVLTGYGKQELETARRLYPDVLVLEQFDKILDALQEKTI